MTAPVPVLLEGVVRFFAPSFLAVRPAALAGLAPAAVLRADFFAGALPEAARLAVARFDVALVDFAFVDFALPDAAPFDAEPRAPVAADACARLRVAGVPVAAGVRPAVTPRAVPAVDVLAAFFAAVSFEAVFFAAAFLTAFFFAGVFFAAARPPAAPVRTDAPRPAVPPARLAAGPERLAGVALPRPLVPVVSAPCTAARPTFAPTFRVVPRFDAPCVETVPAVPYGPVFSVAVRRATELPVVARAPAPLLAARFAVGSFAAIFFARRLPMSVASPPALPDRARADAVAVGVPALRDEGRDALDLPRAVLVMRISRL